VKLAAIALVWVLAGCASTPPEPACLASARVTPDFVSYTIRRVGLIPLAGRQLEIEQREFLQDALASELTHGSPFEIVVLDETDLEEVPQSEPSRRGSFRPATVLALARRYNLDAVLVGTVTDYQAFAPQRLGLSIDLVGVETGIPIWSAEVMLDASHKPVQESMAAWRESKRASDNTTESIDVYMLSPRRFAQFAASQIARVL
jgi:hypothetical protein